MVGQVQRRESERTAVLRREQEANRLKDEFLAALSHELRTPLNAILGWIQILRAAPPIAETYERALASLERNARAQARLIEDLLDVSRIISGKLHLNLAPIDFAAVVESSLDVIRPAAQAKQIEIAVTRAGGTCRVNGDVDRLRQVVWNLLSNAVKFTPHGGRVDVTVAWSGGACELTVRDNGIGIAPEFLPYVFDRFRQADGSMTRQHGGLGLGLAIVREITIAHSGQVRVESDGAGRGHDVHPVAAGDRCGCRGCVNRRGLPRRARHPAARHPVGAGHRRRPGCARAGAAGADGAGAAVEVADGGRGGAGAVPRATVRRHRLRHRDARHSTATRCCARSARATCTAVLRRRWR